MFVVAILPIAIFAMRKNWKFFEWKILFTDNIVRFVSGFILILVASFIITYVPELNDLLTQSGVIVGTASAGLIGFGIGSSLVALLPSDTGFKEQI